MSYCKEEGKDRIIFVTEKDHNTPSSVVLPDDEDTVGLMKEDGSLNWNCPCLGGMATGPCGVEFREAFTCFHYSQADPKGSDCLEPFRAMSSCMAEYPGVYGSGDDDVMAIKDDDDEDLAEGKHKSSRSKDEESDKRVENVAAVKDSLSQESKS